MDWDAVKHGFLDELSKIAEVNTSGVSPEMALKHGPPPVMETAGLEKARELLARADAMRKTASSVAAPLAGAGNQLAAVGQTPDPYRHGKSLAGRVIGGGATGRLLAGITLKKAPISARRFSMGTLAGMGAGAVEYAGERAFKARPMAAPVKTAGILSAGMQLRATNAVGKPRISLNKGMSTKSLAPHIGNAGRLPSP